jgi:nicotinamide-nucleotide amidase
MVVNPDALANVKYIFERVLNRPMIERNLKQAEVPDVCTVINNRRGTAPGMWFEKEGKIFVSMPGVPHEMKGMMTEYVLPRLPEYFAMPAIASRTLLTAGIGESYLAERIKDFEEGLPAYIKLAYLPNYGMVRLRLTGTGDTQAAIDNEIQSLFDTLKSQVADVLVTDKDEPMETAVGRLLQERHRTMSTAESCTGGYIAQLVTSHPGASTYYKGSVVSYANEVKTSVLHVSPDTLAGVGAVSEATVREMIKGVLGTIGTDYAIAVSGIMGPDGGSPGKPVGMVWVAVGNRHSTVARQFNFRFDRRRNIELTATNALNMLRVFILEQEPARHFD